MIIEYNNLCQPINDFDVSHVRLKIAESLLDTVIDSRQTCNYKLVMQLVEKKYRENWFNERDFKLGLRKFDEDLGNHNATINVHSTPS